MARAKPDGHTLLTKLTAALQKAVADPDVRAHLESMGIAAVTAEQATQARCGPT